MALANKNAIIIIIIYINVFLHGRKARMTKRQIANAVIGHTTDQWERTLRDNSELFNGRLSYGQVNGFRRQDVVNLFNIGSLTTT